VRSVLKLATSPSLPQTISKTEQNAAENEAFMGATLSGGAEEKKKKKKKKKKKQKKKIKISVPVFFFFFAY